MRALTVTAVLFALSLAWGSAALARVDYPSAVATAADAPIESVKPSDDATVRSQPPNQNFGNQPTLRISGGTVLERSYVRFKLDDDIPGVRHATLRLFAHSGSTVGFDVRTSAPTWNEHSITWANAPAPSANVVASSGPFKPGVWITLDVTSAVQAAGGGPVSFVLTTTDKNPIVLASEESDDLDPRLIIQVDRRPEAEDDTFTTPRNTPLVLPTSALLANDRDPDGDPLTVTRVAATDDTHGTVALNGTQVVYTPALNFKGDDEFRYWISDPFGATDSAEVTVHVVAPQLSPPVAQNVSATTPEDTPATLTLAATDPNGLALTYSIVSAPSHGTLGPVTGNTVRYTPAANYNGPDSFTYKANDGTLNSNIATVSITVTPVDDPPVASNVVATTHAETPTTIQLSATDIDSATLTYAVVAGPAHGSLGAVGSGGGVTYTPNAGFVGDDSFTYKANDGQLDSNVATVTVHVLDNAPSAASLTVLTRGGVATVVQLAGSDPDGQTLSYTIVAGAAHGTVGTPDGQGRVSYTPASGFVGTDSFTYKVNDGLLDSNVATVTVDVLDNPPVATNVSASTKAGTPVAVQLSATDADGQTLSYTIVAGPAHGSLAAVGSGGSVTYTPGAGFVGDDSFTYKANDGQLDSNVATVTIHVSDNAPVASNVSASTNAGTPVAVQLSATDADGQTLSYAIVAGPAHGSLGSIGSGGGVTYTPGAGFVGDDSFTYKANDGFLDSNVATVTVHVTDNAPVASDVSASTSVGTPVAVQLNATDADGQTLSYAIVGAPAHGSLGSVGSGGSVTYTPGAGFVGTDSFTYKANDGFLDSNVATVTVHVVDNAPVATDVSVSTNAEAPVAFQLQATDADGQTLSYAIVGGPAHGSLGSFGAGGSVTYTPNAGFVGTDTFTYKANDGFLDSNVATATIQVLDNPPVAGDLTVLTTAGAGTVVQLAASDLDGQPLGYAIVGGPAHGSVGTPDAQGRVSYMPAAGFVGTDSFTYKANDGLLDSNIATVTVDVLDNPPAAADVVVTTNAESLVSVQLAGSDPDGQALSYAIVSGPAHGSLGAVGAGGSVLYTPTTGFVGDDTFTYKANDGQLDSNTATVTVHVLDNAPVAADQAVSTNAGTPVAVQLNATDADGQTLSYAIVSGPAHGSLGSVGAGGSVTYSPNAGFAGDDSFTYRANDGQLDSNTATVTIHVLDNAPVASDVTVSTAAGTPVGVQLNATDADGQTLTYAIVSGPAHGSLGAVGAGGSVTYTPNAGFAGDDSFTYKANDGQLDSNTATVTIHVADNAPVASDVTVSTTAGTPVAVQLNATDADGQTLTYAIVSGPAHGSLGAVGAGGSVTYTPSSGYVGDDSFTYKANDGFTDSNTATVTIHVNGGAPVARDDNAATDSNNPLSLATTTLLANDTDPSGGMLTVTSVAATADTHGTVALNGGTVLYTPDPTYGGSASFTYTVTDALGLSSQATVHVAVDYQPSTPVRAAFYYGWYPEAWNQQGLNPFTHYTPTLGFYSSLAVIPQQLDEMRYAGVQVGIASWWGQGDKTDVRFGSDLAGAAGSKFRWAIYYEPEGQGNPAASTIANDLAYIRDHYASDPSYYRINGRFVVFAFDGGPSDVADGCSMPDRWKQANAGINAYVVLKVFSGFATCASQPDAWHQYAPAVAQSPTLPWAFSISPGFWKANESTPRLVRDPTEFNRDICAMMASNAPFQLVTTLNEWGEGSAAESGSLWTSASGYGTYLDELHANGQVNGVCAPLNQTKPTISFRKAQVGDTVTADPGTWYPSGVTVGIQYQRCASDGSGCADIPGATSASYTLTSADVGSTLRVGVTGANAAGSVTVYSSVTAVVVTSTLPSTAAYCGTAATPPAAWKHVIWIWMENKSESQVIGSGNAPFINSVAKACGLATNYAAVAHPSLPNYIAATSGATQGITDDSPPSSHPLAVASLYSQLTAAGLTWHDYEEASPGNCPSANSGLYAVRHDPAAYYTGIAATCQTSDVPLGTLTTGAFATDVANGTLPTFSFVTPDLCNDMHDCSVNSGDNWLRTWLPKLIASPAYQAGTTAIFIVWDENDGSAGNVVPALVVSPSTPAGTQSATAFTHYSLLRTTEELLGLPFLGNAATAQSMRADFHE